MYNTSTVEFVVYPLRFEFLAKDSLFFPPGKAANILRGALGVIFRKIACVPQCRDSKTCDIRETCPYARTFEPSAQSSPDQSVNPSGPRRLAPSIRLPRAPSGWAYDPFRRNVFL